MRGNPFAHHFRLKRPCANCPFRTHGAIQLSPGRVDELLGELLDDTSSTFQCHKTVHHAKGGEWDDEGKYHPAGNEAMCAGAAAVLMKRGRPTILMRIGFAIGGVSPNNWDEAMAETIE